MIALLMFSWMFIGATTQHEDFIEAAAQKCCMREHQECCKEMIRYGKPVKCGYERNVKWAKLLYDCVQKELFKKEEDRIPLDDANCCMVYSHGDKTCETTCRLSMMAPSIRADVKVQNVRMCSIVESPFYKCFDKCRQLRAVGKRIEVLRFDEYCNSTLAANVL